MDTAKAGGAVPAKTCENPVEEHYELGQTMRISGTPALLLEGGELVPGYVPAHKLRQALEENPSRPRYITSVRGAGYRFVP